jgi:hypothetical protein
MNIEKEPNALSHLSDERLPGGLLRDCLHITERVRNYDYGNIAHGASSVSLFSKVELESD